MLFAGVNICASVHIYGVRYTYVYKWAPIFHTLVSI